MAKNVKQLCAGIATAVVLSGAGVHFINKMLQEENNKKKAHETEQVVKNLIAHERAIHNDDNTFEATANVRLRSYKFSHSLKFGNPEEQQIATQQQRAPKKKNTKRKVSRDALAARVESVMEARRGRGKS